MGGNHADGALRARSRKTSLPEIFVDQELDFLSVKLAPGIEARSFLRDGILFSLDAKGSVIELQVLNLSALIRKKKSRHRAA